MHPGLSWGYTKIMDNNLPNDPPNSGNGTPPTFGSHFNPHTNPVDPNNPYQTNTPLPPLPNSPNLPDNNPGDIKHEHYSEVAQHKPRDEHGHFIPSDHTANQPPNFTSPQGGPSSPSIPPNPAPSGAGSFLPPIVEINQTGDPTYKKDPPAFGFFITNPVAYFKIFLNKLIKRQAITIKIPVLAIVMVMVGVGSFGAGFHWGIDYTFSKLFPNYSPVLHRATTLQGTIQKSTKGEYFLQPNDKDKTLWTLKSTSTNTNLADFEGKQVQIKGNLTPTPYLIEVSEVISFDKTTTNP